MVTGGSGCVSAEHSDGPRVGTARTWRNDRGANGIILNTDDIDAAHAELRSLGVDVDGEVARVGAAAEIRIGPVEMAGPVPPMFYFRDPDGNSLLMVQPGQ